MVYAMLGNEPYESCSLAEGPRSSYGRTDSLPTELSIPDAYEVLPNGPSSLVKQDQPTPMRSIPIACSFFRTRAAQPHTRQRL
jgi:hypothetical protein